MAKPGIRKGNLKGSEHALLGNRVYHTVPVGTDHFF
jgi:hypothetical protein